MQNLSETKEQKTTKKEKRALSTVKEEEPHPEDSVNFLQPAKLYESDYSSGEDTMDAVIENSVEKVEPLNMPIKIGNITTTLLVDSGSACSFLNRSLASQLYKAVLALSGSAKRCSHNLGHSRMSKFMSKEKYNLQSQATDGLSIQQHSPS